MTLRIRVDFDGETVATDVGDGASDDTTRTLEIGQNVTGYYGGWRIYVGDAEVRDETNNPVVMPTPHFEYVDNTNTRRGASQDAGIVNTRLLDQMGNHMAGPYGVVVLER